MDIKTLKSIYQKSGIQGIQSVFNRADSYIFEDLLSNRIYTLMNDNKIDKVIKILEQ